MLPISFDVFFPHPTIQVSKFILKFYFVFILWFFVFEITSSCQRSLRCEAFCLNMKNRNITCFNFGFRDSCHCVLLLFISFPIYTFETYSSKFLISDWFILRGVPISTSAFSERKTRSSKSPDDKTYSS